MSSGAPLYESVLHVDAMPEAVFDLFTDPELMRRWMGVRHELEAVPGGTFRVDVTGGDVVAGSYVVVDRPRRIVFTWGWEGSDVLPPGSSTVEVVLRADGDATELCVRHHDCPASEIDAHGQGWEHYLERLRRSIHGDPGPDPWAEGTEAS